MPKRRNRTRDFAACADHEVELPRPILACATQDAGANRAKRLLHRQRNHPILCTEHT